MATSMAAVQSSNTSCFGSDVAKEIEQICAGQPCNGILYLYNRLTTNPQVAKKISRNFVNLIQMSTWNASKMIINITNAINYGLKMFNRNVFQQVQMIEYQLLYIFLSNILSILYICSKEDSGLQVKFVFA